MPPPLEDVSSSLQYLTVNHHVHNLSEFLTTPPPFLFLLTLLPPLRHNEPEVFYSSGVYSGLLSRKTSFPRSDQVGHDKSCTLELELLFGFPDLLLTSRNLVKKDVEIQPGFEPGFSEF